MPTENRSNNEHKMPSELVPCPFCGQQDAFVEQLDSDASVVICQGRIGEHSACLARGPIGVQQDESEDQPSHNSAINEWNRRAAQQHQGEPIMLTAVAELVDDGDGGLEPLWILEGGTAELFAGMTLLIADNAPDLCQEDGSAEVYAHADSGEVEQLRSERDQLQADLTQRDERVDDLEAMLLKIATNLGGTLEQYGLLKEVAELIKIEDAAEPDNTPTITIPPCAGRYDGSENGID